MCNGEEGGKSIPQLLLNPSSLSFIRRGKVTEDGRIVMGCQPATPVHEAEPLNLTRVRRRRLIFTRR